MPCVFVSSNERRFFSRDCWTLVVVLLTVAICYGTTKDSAVAAFSSVPQQQQQQPFGRRATRTARASPLPFSSSSSGSSLAPLLRPHYRRSLSHRRLSMLRMMTPTTQTLVVSVLGHVVLGASGARIAMKKGTRKDCWYQQINLPAWTPPNAWFGPVWTCLYACMGWAVATIYAAASVAQGSKYAVPALVAWGVHFSLNLTWEPLFFGRQWFRAALVVSYGLVGTLLGLVMPLFYTVQPRAAFLLLPYAGLLTYATFGLNRAICHRNPTIRGYNAGRFYAQLQQLQTDAHTYAFGN